MPRNVRNFWIELGVHDAAPISTGPRRADGGFDLTIKQRDQGGIVEVLEVLGRNLGGRLVLVVRDGEGKELAEIVTER